MNTVRSLAAAGAATTTDWIDCPVCRSSQPRGETRCGTCGWLLQGAVVGATDADHTARLDQARRDWATQRPTQPSLPQRPERHGILHDVFVSGWREGYYFMIIFLAIVLLVTVGAWLNALAWLLQIILTPVFSYLTATFS
jgi:hypothetical protein